jgi:hypothetical protein
VWLVFCDAEWAVPSPKFQSKVGVPMQLLGVAVLAKAMAMEVVPVAGTVAVHDNVQPLHPVVVMEPAVPVMATGLADASEAVGVPGACARG